MAVSGDLFTEASEIVAGIAVMDPLICDDDNAGRVRYAERSWNRTVPSPSMNSLPPSVRATRCK